MKSIAVMVAAIFGTLFISAAFSRADTLTLCADQGKFGARPGYVITGINSNFTNWQAKKIIGDIIGDGNCQSGWTMQTKYDPRIQYGSKAVYDEVVVGTETVTKTMTNTESVFNGRKTLAFNGEFPSVIRNVDTGMRKKFIGTDGAGNGLYRTTKDGYYPKGTVQTWSKAKLAGRDVKSGYSGANGHKMRYDHFEDVTTSHTFDTEVPVMGLERRSVSRVFCPTVYTWIMISPSGEAVASTQGRVAPCTIKKY